MSWIDFCLECGAKFIGNVEHICREDQMTKYQSKGDELVRCEKCNFLACDCNEYSYPNVVAREWSRELRKADLELESLRKQNEIYKSLINEFVHTYVTDIQAMLTVKKKAQEALKVGKDE